MKMSQRKQIGDADNTLQSGCNLWKCVAAKLYHILDLVSFSPTVNYLNKNVLLGDLAS